MKRLSLRQSLALWTLIPMVTFSLIMLALSSAWAWRDVRGVAEERNASLVGLAASTLADHDANVEELCARLVELSPWVRGALYVVERSSGRILCASQDARLSAGDSAGYNLAPQADTGGTLSPSSLSDRRHTVSYAPVPGTSWAVILEEPRTGLVATTYSFLVAISALMVVGLFISFWLLLIGFQRISWPLLAVTEQAMRVTEGQEFVPPDVAGPTEVEALVAAFNRMVTQLRQQRNTLYDYAKRMLYSQEEERNRISRDLHDETAQELVGLMQRIDLCRLAAEDNPRVLAALDELSEIATLTLSGVRRMSQALRPLILEDLGLVAAIQAIADDLEGQLPGSEGRVFCEVIGQDQRLPPEVELTAYRIVQEALTNVRKHAGPVDRVYVTVQFKPEVLLISVEDNGRGFRMPQPSPQPDGEHLGLIGMRERAELIDGALSILTRPGEGTRVLLQLPLGTGETVGATGPR